MIQPEGHMIDFFSRQFLQFVRQQGPSREQVMRRKLQILQSIIIALLLEGACRQ
jgi:hypothetical protein